MRQRVLALVLVGAASAAHAQTTTLDGVTAFVRGDFPRAAEILKPIAEAWPPRDRLAEFVMAALYENGLGVPADPIRACALYMRASLDYSTPLSRAAGELLDSLRGSLGPGDFERCMLFVSVGFDHRFQPVTFMLEPGHWISIDLDAATITYDGRENRVDLGLAHSGAVFLPVEHTELRFGPSLSIRRHFIEFFTWMPGGASWTLFWRVCEVVRDELVTVTTAPLVSVIAERPPAEFEVRDVAQLRVDESGYAEWAVLSGPNAEMQLIETEEERREISEQKRSRVAAEARVEWDRVSEVRRAPALLYSDADGCGNIWVYGWSSDRMETITVRADRDLLTLWAGPRAFDLASPLSGLEIRVQVYERPLRSWPFCTDVGGTSTGLQESWKAVAGTVTIELTPPVVRARDPWAYRAAIRIDGLEVVSASGARARQLQPITFTAIVASPVHFR